MKKKAVKEITPMEKLTANYEEFISTKTIVSNGKVQFEKVIKKATKPRSLK
jgi:hypothetical protein